MTAVKEGTLFLDPGFPVHKQQVKMIGHDYRAFDLADYRGSKLKGKLESISQNRENLINTLLKSQ